MTEKIPKNVFCGGLKVRRRRRFNNALKKIKSTLKFLQFDGGFCDSELEVLNGRRGVMFVLMNVNE